MRLALGWVMVLFMLLAFFVLLSSLSVGVVPLIPPVEALDPVRNIALPISAGVLAAFAILPLGFKRSVDSLTIMVLAIFGYMSAGSSRHEAVGKLAGLVQHLQRERQWNHIHLVSYSMGTIVALDALYPAGPIVRGMEAVDTLVTVGSPYDIIQTYWPGYFQNRSQPSNERIPWTNIFFPSDLFASNFIAMDTVAEEPRKQPRTPRQQRQDSGQDTDTGWFDNIKGNVGGASEMVWHASGSLKYGASEILTGARGWSGITVRAVDGETEPEQIIPKNVRHVLNPEAEGPGYNLATMRAHRAYWHASEVHVTGAFDTIVDRLF